MQYPLSSGRNPTQANTFLIAPLIIFYFLSGALAYSAPTETPDPAVERQESPQTDPTNPTNPTNPIDVASLALTSPDFAKAFDQISIDAQAFDSMKKRITKDARLTRIAICGTACVGIAGSGWFVDTYIKSELKKGNWYLESIRLPAPAMTQMVGHCTGFYLKGWIVAGAIGTLAHSLFPQFFQLANLSREQIDTITGLQKKFETEIESLSDSAMHFLPQQNRTELEHEIELKLAAIDKEIKRVKDFNSPFLWLAAKVPTGVFDVKEMKEESIENLLFLKHIMKLDTVFSYLRKKLSANMPEESYQAIRREISAQLTILNNPNAPAKSRVSSYNSIKRTLTRAFPALSTYLVQRKTLEQEAQKRNDSELLEATSALLARPADDDFFRPLIEASLPTLKEPFSLSAESSCLICHDTFGLGEKLVLTCDQCNNGLLHEKCFAKNQSFMIQNRNPRVKKCLGCIKDLGKLRHFQLGDEH
jgi:hypothetical protein